jgi:hypothetical protein
MGKDRPTKYPRGSPRDVLVRIQRTERELRQLLADIRSVNDNHPNFKDRPMDIGRYLVRLKTTREVISRIRACIAAGDPKLPNDILKPLCKPW